MELEMTSSAITIHLETYISRQVNISHFKAGKHHYHKIKIEKEHQAIVIIDISKDH